MVKREGDYQKRADGENRLLMTPREHPTYAQMAARQSQQQRTRMQMPWHGHGAWLDILRTAEICALVFTP
jgi:hypothetical protein